MSRSEFFDASEANWKKQSKQTTASQPEYKVSTQNKSMAEGMSNRAMPRKDGKWIIGNVES